MPSVDSVLSKPKGEKSSEHKSEPKMEHKKHKHGVKKTEIEHHDEGHVVTHHMDDGGQTSHAVSDLDGVHDQLEAKLGEPNEGEPGGEMPAEGGGAEPQPGGQPMPGQGA